MQIIKRREMTSDEATRLATAHRIRAAMLEQGHSEESLAAEWVLEPDSIRRVITGIDCSPKTRQRLTTLLQQEFWPGITPTLAVSDAARALIAGTFSALRELAERRDAAADESGKQVAIAEARSRFTPEFLRALGKVQRAPRLSDISASLSALNPWADLIYELSGETPPPARKAGERVRIKIG